MTWYLLAFASALLSAFAAVLEKRTLFKTTALDFSLLVAFTGFIFAIPFGLNLPLDNLYSTGFLLLVLKTSLNALSFYFIMSALKNLDISNSLPLMELSPGITAILGAIFLSEIPSHFQVLGLLLLIIGAYLINYKKGSSISDVFLQLYKSKGHWYICSALFIFAITSILDKVILVKFQILPKDFIFLHHFITFIIFFVFYLASKNVNVSTLLSIILKDKFLLISVLLVGLLSVFYRYAQILALKEGQVALVLAIKRTSVFFACVIGGTIFKEETLMQRILSTIILIVGSALIILL
jgi:uncharacterized membrane protein